MRAKPALRIGHHSTLIHCFCTDWTGPAGWQQACLSTRPRTPPRMSSTRRWDVKPFVTVIVAGALLGGTILAGQAEAGDRRHHSKHNRGVVVYESYRGGYGYYRPRDVVVIRDYYRPYYRPLPPGLARHYYRGGYLPIGWERRVRPVPVYLEPELVVVPSGYERGIIDGRAVVYNNRGFILDVAVLF